MLHVLQKKTGVRVVAGTAKRQQYLQKGREKGQKTADHQAVEITVWKNYCVLVGEQAARSEEGKVGW